ncbi:MAG: YHS domain-containing protein [Syntrophales bacterium]|jgi:YHS domain-containing protein|nr:YHS domain-containing protein [Syntrophales bacterium]
MLLKLVIVVIAIYLFYKLFRKDSPQARGNRGYKREQKPSGGEDLVEDPVCHTYIPESSALKLNVEGRTVCFCSQKCLETYVQEKKQP